MAMQTISFCKIAVLQFSFSSEVLYDVFNSIFEVDQSKLSFSVLYFEVYIKKKQDRSQPHSPGWTRVPLYLFFPQIFFLILALRVGESPTREGPGYATERKSKRS